jgi:hypothetical protein
MLNLLGVFIYITRILERWYPFRYDIYGCNYQIFHFIIVQAQQRIKDGWSASQWLTRSDMGVGRRHRSRSPKERIKVGFGIITKLRHVPTSFNVVIICYWEYSQEWIKLEESYEQTIRFVEEVLNESFEARGLACKLPQLHGTTSKIKFGPPAHNFGPPCLCTASPGQACCFLYRIGPRTRLLDRNGGH